MTEKMQPLVSVIIPLYNAENYIAACINSILNQTWENIEVIVVDDGSTDNSLIVAKGFECVKVTVLSQQNKGASAARNKGLTLAKGDYIQFLDADDLLKNDKLEIALDSLREVTNGVAICPVVHFNNENETQLSRLRPSKYELEFYKSSTDPFEFLLNMYGADTNQGSMIPLHCWLTPAGVLKKAGAWNEMLTVNDDGEYFCRVLLCTDQIRFRDDTVCYYRKYLNASSLSSAISERALLSEFTAIRLIKQHLEKVKQNDGRINKAIARLYGELIVKAYPKYSELYKRILAEVHDMHAPLVLPVIGGNLIEFIKRVVGWRTARLLQYYNSFRK